MKASFNYGSGTIEVLNLTEENLRERLLQSLKESLETVSQSIAEGYELVPGMASTALMQMVLYGYIAGRYPTSVEFLSVGESDDL